ncbi:MAG: EAL domain-containing protein [Pseudazoarcus pumilus]|nr:EAL domain-containing protein [Pseudazoarcus pumilus]
MAPPGALLDARTDISAPPEEAGWLTLGWWLIAAGTLGGLLMLFAQPGPPADAWAHPLSTAFRYANVSLALLIFLSGWNHQGHASSREMVLAFGFLGVGVLDFVQALSLPTMPDFVTSNTHQKALTLCIAARLLAAGVLLARVLMPERRFEREHRGGWLAITLALTLLVAATILSGHATLPPLVDSLGLRTTTGMLIETLVMLALLATLFLMILRERHRGWHGGLLLVAVAGMMVAELHWLLRDAAADLGHLLGLGFKVVACVALYRLAHLRNLRMPWMHLQQMRSELDEKQRFLDTLITEAPDGVLVVDEHGRIVSANKQLLNDFGYSEADLLGQPVEILLPAAQRQRHASERSNFAQAPYARPMGAMGAVSGACRDGSLLPVEISLGNVTIEGHRCAVAFVRNIEARRKLEEERAHLLSVLEESPDWVFQCTHELKLTYANPAAREAFAIGEQAVHLDTLFAEHAALSLPPEALFGSAMRNGVFSGESHLRCASRGRIPVSIVIVAHRDAHDVLERYSLVARDLSERVGWEQQLAHNATHDSLTGLPNRLVLTERIEQAIDQARRGRGLAALLFLDLDNFKLINDTLGHNAGDQVLVEVSDKLQHCLRQGDTLARFGGDEFVVVAPGLRDTEDATAIARKLLEALDHPVLIGETTVSVNASIGICLIPRDADSAETAMSHADQAMYRSKRAGRGHFRLYAPEHDGDTVLDVELAAELKRAVRDDNGELSLHYQPEVAIGSGNILCVEALLRWNSPRHGEVPPDRFVPLAEETGLILELGQWVMTRACQQLAAWQQAGIHTRMAINISVHELKQPDFAERLGKSVSEHGLTFDAIELEVTETALVQSLESTAENLGRLRALGMRIALDDFGTGYSSLAHLSTLPIDKLKIDREFVNGISHALNNRFIVEALIRLADQLGIEVIAEGVETHADLGVLGELGCESVQGWLFHRPMGGAACTELMQMRSPADA